MQTLSQLREMARSFLNEADFLFYRDTHTFLVEEKDQMGYDWNGEELFRVPAYFRDEVWSAHDIQKAGWKFSKF